MAKTEQSETELSDVSESNKNGGVASDFVSKAQNGIKAFFNFFTVEPYLFCFILPNIISSVAVQKLNMEKACRADLNYTEYTCSDVISGNAEDIYTLTASTEAQTMVAYMTTWTQPIQSGIPAIAILFIGSWSDSTGNRKALMLIPVFGELISSLGLILANYYFLEWPLWVTGLIEALPSAFAGGISIALMGSYSYIADVTTLESRTFRMGCVAVIVTLGIPLGSAISGVLTESVGYYGIFGICAALYAFGFVYTYLRVHDIKNVPMEGTMFQKLIKFFHPLNAWKTLSLLFLSPKRELIQIWLVILAHVVVMGPVFGESPVLFLYTLNKFSMDLVDFSLFSTYSVLMGIFGTAIAVIVFSKRLQMHDALIGIIATSSKVVSSCVYGLAPNRSWFYSGPIFDLFGNSGSTVVRSLGTKVVIPDEVGKMCSLIGFVEAIIPVFYAPLYSTVYTNTLAIFPGAYYIVGGVMTVPAIFVFIILYAIYRREQRDVVKNPDVKEMHAHDNAVSEL
ncbi:proton-coupled folate transporter-like [Pararge aegeria]|uniref:Jg1300 protein n=1 Tax=Pararge aegeria aegeria TaxID=348720 RepID=A0A8S4RCH0_9NEOP|nr:proton-coupled folate transporter-like [Pararge aegeria]CAH2235030.1 jg1300 [Pararge aegeria aegeria]